MRAITCGEDIECGLEALIRLDPRLGPIAGQVGTLPLRLSAPDFAGLAGIVVSQQVSAASAGAIYARLRSVVDPLDAPGVLECGEAKLREAGLSRPKQKTLIAIAEAVVGGGLDFASLGNMPADEAIASMTRIHGIGPWTAEIYLLFCVGHADIFPAGDLALQEAARVALGHAERPKERDLRAIAALWSPWRGIASRLLWAYYGTVKAGRQDTTR